MADNPTVQLTPSTTGVIAADDCGGYLYPRVKACFGVDGSASDVSESSPMPVAGAQVATTYTNPSAITINTVLATIDCAQWGTVSVQCAAMGTSGIVTPEWSNNGSTWAAATLTAPNGSTASTISAAGIWVTPVMGRYLRLRMSTASTAGTTTFALQALSEVTAIPQLATQPVSGTVAVSAVTAGTSAANIGKAEDATANSGDVGIFALAVRRDALTTSASATGKYNEMACNRFGAQLVADYRANAKYFHAAGVATRAAGTAITDIATLYGNATTTVVVTKIICSFNTAAAAGFIQDVIALRRSTAHTGGTYAAQVAIPADSSLGSANSTPWIYSVEPTAVGTEVGRIDWRRAYVHASDMKGFTEVEFNFGEKNGGIVLSGVSQGVSVNMYGLNPASTFYGAIKFEWFEY